MTNLSNVTEIVEIIIDREFGHRQESTRFAHLTSQNSYKHNILQKRYTGRSMGGGGDTQSHVLCSSISGRQFRGASAITQRKK